MRFLVFVFLWSTTALASVPPALEAALKSFRADPPPGWSFTQTTTAQGESLVERCDAAKPAFDRWSLVGKNGRPPTADEARHYAEMRSRRSRGGTAPSVVNQFDLTTVETVAETVERATFRCGLKPAEKGDETAAFLRATIIVHKPTSTVESIELASTGEFSPTFGVKIAEMKTRMTYRPPSGETPLLPQAVETRVRGRAFWFKSLDAEMTVTFSDYEKARKR
jgi:hypothetical protein